MCRFVKRLTVVAGNLFFRFAGLYFSVFFLLDILVPGVLKFVPRKKSKARGPVSEG